MPLDVHVSGGGMAVLPPGAQVLPRAIADHEFVWVMAGDAVWTVEGAQREAPAGTLLLVRPGMRDAFRWDRARRTQVAYVHFDLRRGTRELAEPWPLSLHLVEEDVLRPVFGHITRLLDERPPHWQLLCDTAVAMLLASFVTRTFHVQGATLLPRQVERALRYAADEWTSRGVLRNISVDELARVCRVSPRQLSRLFQQSIGAGPVETLRLLRVESARVVLRISDLGLGAIAEICGFANAFHLSRAFKNAYGVAPSAYRAGATAVDTNPAMTHVRRFVAGFLPRVMD